MSIFENLVIDEALLSLNHILSLIGLVSLGVGSSLFKGFKAANKSLRALSKEVGKHIKH